MEGCTAAAVTVAVTAATEKELAPYVEAGPKGPDAAVVPSSYE